MLEFVTAVSKVVVAASILVCTEVIVGVVDVVVSVVVFCCGLDCWVDSGD